MTIGSLILAKNKYRTVINTSMNYLIYKITNTVNNKIYVGCHKTQNVNDNYMGSGKILQHAIAKYGISKFTKEILHNFNNSEDMFNMESELINEDFVKDKNNYNLKEGGFGGWDYVNKSSKNLYFDEAGICVNGNIDGLIKAREIKRWLIENDQNWCKTISNKIKDGLTKYYKNGGEGAFKNKQHTDKSKAKIGKANSIKQQGSGNSQYGTMWITNGIDNKKIPKDQNMPNGFKKGRKMK